MEMHEGLPARRPGSGGLRSVWLNMDGPAPSFFFKDTYGQGNLRKGKFSVLLLDFGERRWGPVQAFRKESLGTREPQGIFGVTSCLFAN